MTSPSRRRWPYIIAALLLTGAACGLAAWHWRPKNPHRDSDTVIREFAKKAGREVSLHRRSMRALGETKPENVTAALTAVDARTNEALSRLHAAADEARAQIDAIDDLPLRTQENRSGRIDDRTSEAEDAITKQATEAKAIFQGTPRAPTPSLEKSDKDTKKKR